MKRSPSDLAILGGPPEFAEPLHVGRPNVPDRRDVLSRIGAALDARRLSNDGPCVQELERRLCGLLGARHCVAVANGTLALMLAAHAAELRGEVIMPSFTFVGTPHALLWQGLTPVFCDIDPVTLQIDPEDAASKVTPRTSAILGVHVFGRPCDVVGLEAVAARHGLKLLFDAAHAVGCTYRGGALGARGLASAYSFHATKVFNTFEGGAVATDDEGLASRVRTARSFGFVDYDRVNGLGINAKLSEPAAAMGLASLDCLDAFIQANRRNHEVYRSALAGVPGVRLLPYDLQEASNYHYVVAEIDEQAAAIGRDGLVAVLRAENVLARRYFHPGCHRMEPYVSTPPWRGAMLPATERCADRVIAFPTGMAIEPSQIERIVSIVAMAANHGREIATALASVRR